MTQVAARQWESYLARFGLSSFRPGQSEVIATVMSGRDCLCVMPTGGGKSLCYQLPALALEGLTLVVSPLIALMKDQVDQLEALGIPVTFINSTLPLAEQYARLERMAAGQYRLVYVVPERFRSARFLEAVRSVELKLLAVDEAHCISEWGHDFRPDYARLGHFRRRLGNPPTIALTATATDTVRRDIVEQLDLNDPKTFITGFARPNLFYEVQCPRTERQKIDYLLDLLGETPGSGIVYASTRKRTEEVAQAIAERTGRRTIAYHAGLLPDQRRRAQEAFMHGEAEIVAATNAFGMGIDKADVRFVVHYNLPGTLEAYYQEAGRAGRDGHPSRCLLLYHPSDRFVQEFFIESAYPDREYVARVYDYLRGFDADPIELTQMEIKERLGLPIGAEGIGACEQLLESAGALERLVASQNTASVRLDSELPTLVDMLPKQAKVQRRVLQAIERFVGTRRNEMVPFQPRALSVSGELDSTSLAHALRELNQLQAFTYIPPFRGRAIRMLDRQRPFDQLEIDFDALEQRKASEYEKLRRMISFAMSPRCRQQEILHYFGENGARACGHCDRCRSSGRQRSSQAAASLDNERVLKTVRIVLSGVARTQNEMRFGCGKNLVAQMLCGSGSAKMGKLGLNRLSTFGLLKDLTQTEVVDLIEGLITLGYLEQVEIDPRRPVVQLTPSGAEVMKGEVATGVELPIPVELARKLRGEPDVAAEPSVSPFPTEPPEDLPPIDPELVARLKRWRQEQASQRSMPAYCILSNAAVESLARSRPDSIDALLELKGIGPATVERYGPTLVELILQSDHPSSGTPSPMESTGKTTFADPAAETGTGQTPSRELPLPEEESTRPSYYWTWRLLSAGFSARECCEIQRLGRKEIVNHALEAAENGRAVRAEWCLDAELLSALEAFLAGGGSPSVPTILADLPVPARHDEVALFLKCRDT